MWGVYALAAGGEFEVVTVVASVDYLADAVEQVSVSCRV